MLSNRDKTSIDSDIQKHIIFTDPQTRTLTILERFKHPQFYEEKIIVRESISRTKIVTNEKCYQFYSLIACE